MLAARACLAALAATRFSNSHTGPPCCYETLVGAPRRIQSRTSAGWNLLPLTPNRCDVRRPRRYARRTVSSWQPMNSATSNAVISRFGNPLFAGDVVAGGCAAAAVSADSVYAVFLIGTSAHVAAPKALVRRLILG